MKTNRATWLCIFAFHTSCSKNAQPEKTSIQAEAKQASSVQMGLSTQAKQGVVQGQPQADSGENQVAEPNVDIIAQTKLIETEAAERFFSRKPNSVQVIKYPDNELGVTIDYRDKDNTKTSEKWCNGLMWGLKTYANHWLGRGNVKAVAFNWYEKENYLFVNVLLRKDKDGKSDWILTPIPEVHKLFKQAFFHARLKMECPAFFK